MNFNGGVLSGSTNGIPIPLATTATEIHQAGAGSGDNNFDEVWLWVTNTDSVTRELTVLWGGVTEPGDCIAFHFSIPPDSQPIPIVQGQRLNDGLHVKAYCITTPAVLNITGHFNRATS